MSGRSRQTVAIWVGAGIAVLVVVAVLLTTLGSGSSSTSAPPATVPGPTIPLASSEATQLLLELPVPDGDYDAFCDAARELGTDVDPDDPMALLRVVLDSDLDALIAGAPEGLVGPLTRLRDEGPGVTTVLDQVDSIADLTPADLPEGFLRDFGVVMRATLSHCYDVVVPTTSLAPSDAGSGG